VVVNRSYGSCWDPEVSATIQKAVSTSTSACANMFEAGGPAEWSSNKRYSIWHAWYHDYFVEAGVSWKVQFQWKKI
jgi:hypothetical protein